MTKHHNRYKTLNFGTIRRVHELLLNKKKQKLTSRILGMPQQGSNFNNFIHSKPLTPRGTFFNNSIKIATGNVQSLKKKEQTLLHEQIELDIDIMLVTETWLTEDDTVWLDSCDFNKDTYRIQPAHHQTSKGGGLALIHRSTSEVMLVAIGQIRSFEHATWSLTISRKTITVTGICHPPPKDKITNGMFIDDITEHLTSLPPVTINNIIMGDFNMHINNMNSNDAVIFKDTLTTLGLTQHVTTSTHAKGNILDTHLYRIGNKHQTYFMPSGTLPVGSQASICST